jgi:hypothetical protein
VLASRDSSNQVSPSSLFKRQKSEVHSNQQLCTLRKPFKPDWNKINDDDLISEANIERRKVYRERFNLEQKKEILVISRNT